MAAEPEAMNWPYLRRGDFTGILFVAVLFTVMALVMLFLPQLKQDLSFGPEWQCARMEQGDPICVRLVDEDDGK